MKCLGVVIGILFVSLSSFAFTQTSSTEYMPIGSSKFVFDPSVNQYVNLVCGTGTMPPPPPALIVSISCDPYTNMIIQIYDEHGSQVGSDTKYFMSSDATCNKERKRILNNTNNGHLVDERVVAFCDPYTNMIKLQLSRSSISETGKQFEGSADKCDSEAKQFNSLFH